MQSRKAFGLAFKAMNGSGVKADAIYAWPGAEIGRASPAMGRNQPSSGSGLPPRREARRRAREHRGPRGRR